MLSLKAKEHEMLLKRGEHIDESDLIKAPVCDGTREERLQSLLEWQRQVAKTVLGEEQEAIPHLLYK
ncbi:TPA: hypothetical protein OT856_004890 [Escherichia coli]|uniref:hypothetical protein n=1 Tax=Enterobacterales TaxID=91347 RepID=UPI0005AA7512|nr:MULTISPECIES: hypothetical protein [Enterobacterales]HAU5609740.1 hypothetical protein [Citrobacter koseri]AVT59746.1 hypothetical protein OA04_32210 [Pectobacterium versatile]EFU8366337.1 hypothetical protein [Escherichia coli]EKZ5772714.1 hypothetical protein [Klebsiella pneumoniae]EKZ5775539.1 hypothetical protein [Klebsiella pneumoniae]